MKTNVPIDYVGIYASYFIYINISKGECKGKQKLHFRLDYAKPHLYSTNI